MRIDRLLDRVFQRTRAKGPRRYIPVDLGVAGFFHALNQAGIRYVVLRWFETLPAVEPGEDIDMLIADDGLERLDKLLTGTQRTGIPCDIYTVSGLPGTDYCGVAYFPPNLAEEVLRSSTLAPNGVMVPDARYHLLTMVYHVLLHKGYLSGLAPVAHAKPRSMVPEHDYADVLTALAEKAGVSALSSGHLDMASLLDFLATKGWRPPNDTLEKLARENNWIQDALLADGESDPSWDGVEVFLIRERGVEFLSLIRDELRAEGFNLLHEEQIPVHARSAFAKATRGGDWGPGPFASNAGEPACVLVMLDLFPQPPSKALEEQFFGLANERTYKAKLRVRGLVNAQLQPDQHCNAVHSSDNPRQALDYFALLQSTQMQLGDMKTAIRSLRNQVALPWPAQRIVGQPGRRAIKRVVAYEGNWVICKTFRPGCERHLQNELLAREVGKGMPEIVPVMAHQGLHLLFPFHESTRRRRFFTGTEMQQLRHVIRHFRSQGYELTDFTPDHIVQDRNRGLQVLDFESLETGTPCSHLRGCRCWYDTSRQYRPIFKAHTTAKDAGYFPLWYDRTGLPRWVAVRDTPNWIIPPIQFTVRATFAGKQFAKNWRDAGRRWLARS